VDVHRPAAILQLQTLAAEVGASHAMSDASEKPVRILDRALDEASRSHVDVLIVDTAGRLHIADEMMQEVRAVHERAKPHETLFVVASMAGPDAVNAAMAFGQALDMTGIVLTKADGDAKGGVVLSVREVTGTPIGFVGVGDEVDALDAFHPDRMASRILGMGDVLTLVEEIEQKVSKDKTEQLAKKLKKGRGFDLSDLRDQLEQMMNMGGLGGLLDKMPGMGQLGNIKDKVNDKDIKRLFAIIQSMTPQERSFPDIIKGSRKKRIALGAGVQVQEVNKIMKQ